LSVFIPQKINNTQKLPPLEEVKEAGDLGTTFPGPGQRHKKIIKKGGINFYSPVKTGKTFKWGFLIFRGDGKNYWDY
jgi:hypothetical protein